MCVPRRAGWYRVGFSEVGHLEGQDGVNAEVDGLHLGAVLGLLAVHDALTERRGDQAILSDGGLCLLHGQPWTTIHLHAFSLVRQAWLRGTQER